MNTSALASCFENLCEELLRLVCAIEVSLDELDDPSGSCCARFLIDSSLGRSANCPVKVLHNRPDAKCTAEALISKYALTPGRFSRQHKESAYANITDKGMHT